MTIVMAGCGALGSQIALHIAIPASRFLLIDDDRIEDVNVITGTSAFLMHQVGGLKALVLAEMVYCKCGAQAKTDTRTLTPRRQHILRGAGLVIDTFDNAEARRLTCGLSIPVVHVGVSAARTGAVIWDEHYTLREDEYGRGHNPICTHQMGRQILRFTAAVAAGVIEHFFSTGEKRSMIVTEGMKTLV